MIAETSLPAETILLVDSDAVARATIAEYLRGCGYRVLEAANTAEAILALETHAVDVVVSDVELSDDSGGGFGLAAWVRSNTPSVTMILTSSVERSVDAAGDLCEEGPMLRKPYHPQLLLDQIRRLRAK